MHKDDRQRALSSQELDARYHVLCCVLLFFCPVSLRESLMNRLLTTLTALALLSGACNSWAASFNSTNIPGGGPSSFTTGDGLVTLTPTLGGNPSTIGGGGSGCCFGVINDQVNDADGNPATTADQEAMHFALSPNVVLNSLSFIWTRATGDNAADLDEGIRISGFLSDPLVKFYSADNPVGTLNNLPGEVSVVGYSAGTLVLNHAWRGGAITVFEFDNPAATLGQTLTLTVADRDEANPQANLHTVTYSEVPVVPEPSSVALALTGAIFAFARRRNAN